MSSFLGTPFWFLLYPIYVIATWYEPQSDNLLPRGDSQSAVGLYNNTAYIIGGRDFASQITKYDVRTNTMIDMGANALAAPLQGGYGQYWTQQKSIIYIIMGENKPTKLATFNMATNELTTNWKTLQTSVDIYGCLASSSHYLYIIGGYDGSTMISSMQILSLSTFEWSTDPKPPSMNERRGAHACIVKNNHLWAFGGMIGIQQSLHRTNERIYTTNITQNAWQYVESTLMSLKGLRVVARNDYIYIIGGDSAVVGSAFNNDIYIMNANNGTVTESSDPMPHSIKLFTSIIIESIPALFVFGGMGSSFDGGAKDAWAFYTLSSLSPSRISTIAPSRNTFISSTSSSDPSSVPTTNPSIAPSADPSSVPTANPSIGPSLNPTNDTLSTTHLNDEESTSSDTPFISTVISQPDNVFISEPKYKISDSTLITTAIVLIISIAVLGVIGVILYFKVYRGLKYNMHSMNTNIPVNNNAINNVPSDEIKPKVVNAANDELECWFTDCVQLPQYHSCFVEYGYDKMSFINNIKEQSELEAIGVKAAAHRTRIWAEIKILQKEHKLDPVPKPIIVVSGEMNYVDVVEIEGGKQAIVDEDEVVIDDFVDLQGEGLRRLPQKEESGSSEDLYVFGERDVETAKTPKDEVIQTTDTTKM